MFRSAGIPDPEVDASLLLSHLCGRAPLELRLDLESQVDSGTLERFHSLTARRMTREPLQYILREAPFFGYLFEVDPRVLIPRPETELLCEWGVEILKEGTGQNVLDLCCGSGCLGISMKLKCPEASVYLSDISDDALYIARSNASRLGADVRLIRSDLFSSLSNHSFDLIISNPPYIPTDTCQNLQPEVMAEPMLALDGGCDGLDFYRRICRESRHHLFPGGMLMMELGDGEASEVRTFMEQSGFTDVMIRNDYQSLPRMICGRII